MKSGTMPQGGPRANPRRGQLSRAAALIVMILLAVGILPDAAVPLGLRIAQGAGVLEVRPEFDDAELTDVTFIDALRGWAVGDRGVIWQTADGGENWHLQASGVSCRLESVQFLDDQIGWVAGGAALPPGDLSRGVILTTRDGGRSWHPLAKLQLPAIRKLRFVDSKKGWCLGEPSALFPTGVATTADGGRTWEAMSGTSPRGWITGDLPDAQSGALAGAVGGLAPVRRRAIESGKSPSFGLRTIHSLKLARDGSGWLVGDAGLVLSTTDGGRSWQVPPGELPSVAAQLDCKSVATVGKHVWIAGEPGSIVLHSADGGASWSLQTTRQTLPLDALTFVDPEHGWAVGTLGTVLATADGGRTWQRQREGGTRAAWLALLSEPHDLPLEIWGKFAAGEGYLGAVEFVARRDTPADASSEFARGDRARQALTELGATSIASAWRFPLGARGLSTSTNQVLEAWNQANDGRAAELLEEHLVRVVRTWRPDLVVTHAAYPRGDHPLEHLVNQATLRAVEAAADATRHPEQITQLGLTAWQVKKVVGGPVPPTQDCIRLRTAELVSQLNESLTDLTEIPRSILNQPAPAANQELAYRVYLDRIPQRAGAKDFFAGIMLPPGGEARRRQNPPDLQAAERNRQLAVRTRNLQSILARSSQDGRGGAQVVGAIGSLVEGFDGPVAGRVLYRLGQDYVRRGEWDLAAETMNLLVDRYPQHPLAGAALLWQLRYNASSEIAWRLNKDERLLAQQVSAAEPGNRPGEAPLVRPIVAHQPVQADALVENANRIGVDHAQHDGRAAQAIAVAKRIEELDPARAREPAVVFPLARAYRSERLTHESDRLLLMLKQTRPQDAWWNCAAVEQWLAKRDSECPKAMMSASRAHARPRLDGELDDTVWAKAERVDLKSAANEGEAWPAAALLAYDAEYLYVAVSCRRAAGVEYATQEAARQRDADLSKRDRVELLLDLDRDAATWYHLTVDAQGWTADACCEDGSWNPLWYVATATHDDVWTVEIAIPFDQLTRDYPRPKSAWSVGMQRTVPGVGFQSWTRPATPSVTPEGFGLLIFD